MVCVWPSAASLSRSARTGLLPNGERIPSVHVERRLSTGACCWARELVDVDDDLESRYLAAQCSKLEFALTVPNHGEPGLLMECGS